MFFIGTKCDKRTSVLFTIFPEFYIYLSVSVRAEDPLQIDFSLAFVTENGIRNKGRPSKCYKPNFCRVLILIHPA